MRRTTKNTIAAAADVDLERLAPVRISANTFEDAVPSRVVRTFLFNNDFARIDPRGRVRIMREGFSVLLDAKRRAA